MPPNKRPIISKYPGDSVAANDSDNTLIGQNPIQGGKQLRITCFGASLAGAGRVELQKRVSLGPPVWDVIRAVHGPGHGHYENLQPIEGDGTISALRIVRFNDEGTAQVINAWVEGIRR
jgi:hypothetical protein